MSKRVRVRGARGFRVYGWAEGPLPKDVDTPITIHVDPDEGGGTRVLQRGLVEQLDPRRYPFPEDQDA